MFFLIFYHLLSIMSHFNLVQLWSMTLTYRFIFFLKFLNDSSLFLVDKDLRDHPVANFLTALLR